MSLGITKQQTKMVAVLIFGAFLTVFNLSVLSPVLPVIMADMDVDATTVQLLSSVYGLVEAIVIPLSAWLLGRFRTRQLFIGGELLFTLGSLVAALAPGFPVLLLGRMIQAAATGVVMTMTMTLIVLIFPRAKRGTAMGMAGLVIGFAPAIGPTIGGVIADVFGWRFLFVVIIILGLLIIAFASKILTDFEGFEPTRFDAPSVALSSLGLLLFLYGASTVASSGMPLVSLACMVAGALFLFAFFRRQGSLEVPFLSLGILRTRRYRTGVIVAACLQAVLVGSSVVFPLFMQHVLGQSAIISGLAMLPGATLGALVGFFSGRLFDRVGIRPLVLAGSVLILVAAVLLTMLNSGSSMAFVVLAHMTLGFSLQALFTPMNTWAINSLSNNVVQHANAVSNTVNQVAGSFGTALIVSLSALSISVLPQASGVEQIAAGYHYSFLGVALLLAVACLVVVFAARNKEGDMTVEDQETALTKASEGTYGLADVMNGHPTTLSSEASLKDAIRLFSQTNTSGAVVVDKENHVLGFLSTGDIIQYLGDIESSLATVSNAISVYRIFEDKDFKDRVSDLLDLNVMDIATEKVISIDSNASLEKACTVLASNKLKKLPIMEDKKLVGTISRKNVVNAIAQILE